jgi:AcrR family transcriptional regulator
MAPPKKPLYPGAAAPVQARTRLARAAVVEAARKLFLHDGYGATTIEAISAAAGVPPATVYRLFSSKLGILKSLLDTSIAGDDDEVAVAARPHVRALLGHADPRSQLAGFVQVASDINARVGPIYRVLVAAASSDRGAAALFDELSQQRQEGQRNIARSLARRRGLRTGLSEREAADIIHALLSPELYGLLVFDRGWKPKRYEQWMADTLVAQLLEPAPR